LVPLLFVSLLFDPDTDPAFKFLVEGVFPAPDPLPEPSGLGAWKASIWRKEIKFISVHTIAQRLQKPHGMNRTSDRPPIATTRHQKTCAIPETRMR